jgi:hypothetical protein
MAIKWSTREKSFNVKEKRKERGRGCRRDGQRQRQGMTEAEDGNELTVLDIVCTVLQ